MSDKGAPSWTFSQISACSYCQHYRLVGTHAAEWYCQNKQSPYYDDRAEDWIGTDLTTAQRLRGCEQIAHNGQKVPAYLFKVIPRDSCLRRVPPEAVVHGYSSDMDLSSDTTVAELTRRYTGIYDAFIGMLEKHGTLKIVDGHFVPADDSDGKE